MSAYVPAQPMNNKFDDRRGSVTYLIRLYVSLCDGLEFCGWDRCQETGDEEHVSPQIRPDAVQFTFQEQEGRKQSEHMQ